MFKKYPLLIVMAVLTVILFFAAWNTGNFYILLTACTMAAFVIVGYCYPVWALYRITLGVDSFPGELDDRTPVAITMNSFNKGWLARRELFFELKTSPLSGQSAYSISMGLPVIKPGVDRIGLQLGNMRRGRYLLSQETACYTGFPFGLIERRKPVVIRQDSMLVRPYRFPVDNRILDLLGVRSCTAIQTRQSAGHSSEFFGIREYRYGDSMRHIDWKMTAKHSEIIVREFEEVINNSFIIAVNCSVDFSPPDDTHDIFEKSIRVAASIATSLLEARYSVGLYTNSAQLYPSSDSDQEIKIMDVLTDTENLRCIDYWPRLHEYIGSLSSPQTILLLSNVNHDISSDQHANIRMLTSLGHEIRLIVFSSKDRKIKDIELDIFVVPAGADTNASFF